MNKFSEITIKSSLTNYKVIFTENDDLRSWVPSGSFYLVDDFFKGKLSISKEENVFWIKADENAKSFLKLNEIFISLKKFGCNRDSSITAIGGGVVQDIATIISSLYMRGINWNYIPTTFLGMTDSCLGGKS